MMVPSSFSIENEKYDDDGVIKRTGTWVTASAHIVSAVIGSGVLSLSWAVAQLGWIGGTVSLLIFSLITLLTSSLTADCYRYPDPVHGVRNPTYKVMVKNILGGFQYKLCALAQYTNLVGVTIGFTLTGSISMEAINKSNCFHKHGHEADCSTVTYQFMAIFGIFEIILSQIPNFHKLSWLSILASVMSFSYAFIGIGLSIAKIAVGGNHVKTGLTGLVVGVDVTSSEKMWNSFQAIGNIAFAYAFSMDTLKSVPPENQVMKKSNIVGISITTFFYSLCGLLGYAAFGNNAPGNFLTGFGFYEPFWLIDIANIFITVHLVGAYQLFAQPIYSAVESWSSKRWPQRKLITKEYLVRIPLIGTWRMNMFKLIWRTVYVIIITLISITFPFFNNVVGFLGAISFFPLTVYFPIEMYLTRAKVPKYSLKWTAMKALSVFCLAVTLVAAVGSVEGIISELKAYKPFKSY
ncbi:Amino acid permease 6, variant 2 [Lathyrus oleraceus]|uniref:Amino acid permease 6, variant 2 n=1 Tax=Pisum sativum TaxID=3888 RepID=A0A9D4WHQ6_PEA|nr:Amino acid permease 6, variant 2 [Pisum sativum]